MAECAPDGAQIALDLDSLSEKFRQQNLRNTTETAYNRYKELMTLLHPGAPLKTPELFAKDCLTDAAELRIQFKQYLEALKNQPQGDIRPESPSAMECDEGYQGDDD